MIPGIITIKLEDVTFQETERCRKVIHQLFEQGVFNMRRGDVVLSFDERGELGSIKFDFVKWRKDKPDVEIKRLEQFMVEMLPAEKSTIAKSLTTS